MELKSTRNAAIVGVSESIMVGNDRLTLLLQECDTGKNKNSAKKKWM